MFKVKIECRNVGCERIAKFLSRFRKDFPFGYKVWLQDDKVLAAFMLESISEEEELGFDEAIGKMAKDYATISKNVDLRFLRTGKYPVLRGTVVSLTPNQHLLYTTGFIPRVRTYPGHRIPRPLLITHHGDSEIKLICSEILGLTKLNWNTTAFSTQLPITLEFAQRVGKVLSELSTDTELQDHYRFYM
ncbi:hypothetical protein MUP77_02305 [Candidatus Bathyarchaeota archaeon]|nr:hypothetical protein [Candidatus Bathyarchaeota archaeon]